MIGLQAQRDWKFRPGDLEKEDADDE